MTFGECVVALLILSSVPLAGLYLYELNLKRQEKESKEKEESR